MIQTLLRAVLLAAMLGTALSCHGAQAAARQPSGSQPSADAMAVAQANAGTVGIISGEVDGTDARVAADLAAVLDDGDQLRVLAVIGKGSVQNIADVMYLDSVDIGIVQSDTWAYAKDQQLFPGMAGHVEYIAKLYDEEVHVLARGDMTSVESLAGQEVNVDVRGSGTAITASILLSRLGITVKPTYADQDAALEMLKRGAIAALVYVSGKPTRLFSDLGPESGLHFLPIPPAATLDGIYAPSQLNHADYSSLIPDGTVVPTVSVSAVMAVHAWQPGTERYDKVVRFVDAFFSKFPQFLQPQRHLKWREVDLTAQVPGWTRFAPAEEWLITHQFPATAGNAALRTHLADVPTSPNSLKNKIPDNQ